MLEQRKKQQQNPLHCGVDRIPIIVIFQNLESVTWSQSSDFQIEYFTDYTLIRFADIFSSSNWKKEWRDRKRKLLDSKIFWRWIITIIPWVHYQMKSNCPSHRVIYSHRTKNSNQRSLVSRLKHTIDKQKPWHNVN